MIYPDKSISIFSKIKQKIHFIEKIETQKKIKK